MDFCSANLVLQVVVRYGPMSEREMWSKFESLYGYLYGNGLKLSHKNEILDWLTDMRAIELTYAWRGITVAATRKGILESGVQLPVDWWD
jgi:hypothetical protein